jgi:hypothetical protein
MRITAHLLLAKYRAPSGKSHDRKPAVIGPATLFFLGFSQKTLEPVAANRFMQGCCAHERFKSSFVFNVMTNGAKHK